MSTHAAKWAMAQINISPRSKLVLLALADLSGPDNRSWPTIKRLATTTCQSRNSVKRCLSELTATGLIRIDPRYDADGRQAANAYVLLAGDVVP